MCYRSQCKRLDLVHEGSTGSGGAEEGSHTSHLAFSPFFVIFRRGLFDLQVLFHGQIQVPKPREGGERLKTAQEGSESG